MAEPYSDEELLMWSAGEPLSVNYIASVRRVLRERDATVVLLRRAHVERAIAEQERDKAEDAAGRLGEDMLLARRERDDARRVAKVLAGYVKEGRGVCLDPVEWTALRTALAYPGREP